jgi:hypothetical protein
MAISATYLQLQNQIADELGDRRDLLTPLSDSDLALSPIQNAIQTAIAKWEHEPFYFTELYSQGAFDTIAGEEFYTTTDVPAFASLPYIQQVRVLINNNRYTVDARTWEYLERISVGAFVQSSYPFDFAYFAGTMRLYPIPNGVIPVTLMANTRLSPLTFDSDANAWTTEGYDLIRCEAKLILANEVLYDDDIARRMVGAIHGVPGAPGYLYGLRAETSRRAAGHRVIPTQF